MLTRESLGVNGGSNHVDTAVAGVGGGQIMLTRESLGSAGQIMFTRELLGVNAGVKSC